jgi:hypothetical protein
MWQIVFVVYKILEVTKMQNRQAPVEALSGGVPV